MNNNENNENNPPENKKILMKTLIKIRNFASVISVNLLKIRKIQTKIVSLSNYFVSEYLKIGFYTSTFPPCKESFIFTSGQGSG